MQANSWTLDNNNLRCSILFSTSSWLKDVVLFIFVFLFLLQFLDELLSLSEKWIDIWLKIWNTYEYIEMAQRCIIMQRVHAVSFVFLWYIYMFCECFIYKRCNYVCVQCVELSHTIYIYIKWNCNRCFYCFFILFFLFPYFKNNVFFLFCNLFCLRICFFNTIFFFNVTIKLEVHFS